MRSPPFLRLPPALACSERMASSQLEDLPPQTKERAVELSRRLSYWMELPNLAERSYHAQEMTAPAGSMGYMVSASACGGLGKATERGS